MAFKITPGLQSYMMVTGAFTDAMNGSLIKIYGSATSQVAADALVPATAGAALGSALLLCTVSVDDTGTGLTFETTAPSGVLAKATAETWVGTNLASGYPSFYRLALIADTGAADTTAYRCQGSVGVLGTDLIIAAAYMTIGQEQRVDSYVVGMPSE